MIRFGMPSVSVAWNVWKYARKRTACHCPCPGKNRFRSILCPLPLLFSSVFFIWQPPSAVTGNQQSRRIQQSRCTRLPKHLRIHNFKCGFGRLVGQNVRTTCHRYVLHLRENSRREVPCCSGDTAGIRSRSPFSNRAHNCSCTYSCSVPFYNPFKPLLHIKVISPAAIIACRPARRSFSEGGNPGKKPLHDPV
jgi:hypothetical protein